jgi:hypothetical protein
MLLLKSFFKVKFRSVVLGCLLYRVWLCIISIKKPVVHKQGKIFMNNEKTEFVRQVAKVDLV